MIEFYPRDIGLWRDDFDFRGSQHPAIKLDSEQDLIDFIKNHFPMSLEDEALYPVRFLEEENHNFGTTHIVHRWTLLGWVNFGDHR